MCEAFIEHGVDLALIAPSTHAAQNHMSAKDFYGLRVEIPQIQLPAPDWYASGRFGFFVSSIIFTVGSLAYLWSQRLRGKRGSVYTVDMDTFSFSLLPLSGLPCIAEMHTPKPRRLHTKFFFKRARIVTTNPLIAQKFKEDFGVSSIVEPNGVDASFFDLPDKLAAREKLGLPAGERMVLYVGRFYRWKGLEVLPPAAALVKDAIFRVLGGTKSEFERVFGNAGNLEFAEVRPDEVPLWLAAADVLLVIGTNANQESNRYTAPMKVFEYLASGKPIVASRTEALQSLVPDTLVHYCDPDNPPALARAVEEALVEGIVLQDRTEYAQKHTWAKRAERIMTPIFE